MSDIHGYYSCLRQVLARILPLRPADQLIILGDYVDRGPQGYEVIETLADLSKKYPNQVITLTGNHEILFLASVGILDTYTPPGSPTYAQVWLSNGGVDTVRSYCLKAGVQDWKSFPLHRMAGIIPEKHKEFLLNTQRYHETEDYIFVHAGCDPNIPLDKQTDDTLFWDRSLYNFVRKSIKNKTKIPWSKVVVTGHNYTGPIFHEKYIMVDSSEKKNITVIELNSMQGFFVYPNRERMLKFDIEETVNV